MFQIEHDGSLINLGTTSLVRILGAQEVPPKLLLSPDVNLPKGSKESCIARPIPVHRSGALRPHESPATFFNSSKTAIHPR
jgi:hypothetical protein